ncbi:MAG: TetR/AcrR family transcriptional regulator [Lachnospiraceae bacterium]|nr:TetR/AcrR family transcriptional regulator [Lachnospiraceae bacterium]
MRKEGELSGTKTEDKRVIRTKQAIRDAFWTLLEERNFEKISVSDLADRAGINRKTFYAYYDSLDALVEEVEDDLTKNYEPIFRDARSLETALKPYDFINRLNAQITLDYHKLSLFNHKGLLPHYIEKIKCLLIEIFRAEDFITMDEKQDARFLLFLEFTTAGALSMLSSWTQKRHLTIEEFTDLISAFILQDYAIWKNWKD